MTMTIKHMIVLNAIDAKLIINPGEFTGSRTQTDGLRDRYANH